MTMLRTIALAVPLLLAACGGPEGTPIEDQKVTVACGACVFQELDRGIPGCWWAAEIDGKVRKIQGEVPLEHDAHEPGGMCTMKREAVITGEVREDVVISRKMELVPLPYDKDLSDELVPHEH